MGVTFVLGRAGSGKSRILHGRTQELCRQGRPVIYIVPEQFTFETERELSAFMGGLMNAAVFSFTTLSRRVLREAGENTVFLSPQGRRMLIRKSAAELKGSLLAFGGVCGFGGFAEKCDGLFSLFKRFNITPEELYTAAGRVPEGLLERKLKDLAALYGDAEAHLAGRYMDENDALNAFLALVPSSFIKGAEVIIDGFDLLTEQLYAIIAAIMQAAENVHISVRMDPGPAAKCRDSAVFVAEARAFARLQSTASAAGLATAVVRMPQPGVPQRQARAELQHIEQEAFAFPYSVFEGPPPPPEVLRLYAAATRMQEVEAMADAVVSAAKRGVRYRDMAVVAADMEAYAALAARAFSKRGIPFFMDFKHSLSGYAAPRLLLAALGAITRGMPAFELVAMGKTGLAGVSAEECEVFENYCLRCGIRGSAFLRPFEAEGREAAAEAARAVLVPPLVRLRERLAASALCREKAAALYEYMEELGLYEKLSELTEGLRAGGRLELMEENSQVYNKLMELLDQLHSIMGDVPMSNSRFLEVFGEGLSAYEVGAIPTTADQLLFGSVGRTRARSIRALFVVGATQDAFPRYHADDGVIDDTELQVLAGLGLTPWDSNADRNGMELANAYGALTKPAESLYISWPARVDADPAQPSPLVDRLLALFPGLEAENGLLGFMRPECAGAGLLPLVRRLRAFADGQPPAEDTAALYAYYAGNPKYSGRLAMAEEALYHKSSPEPFGKELATELYGVLLAGSPTRMEVFNACPFKHFARYGLKALPRREYRERPVDEGAFCHEALSLFVRRIAEEGEAAPETDVVLDELLPELIQRHNGGVLLSSARARARCAELVRRVRATARALRLQLKGSGFSVVGSEVEFGLGKALPAIRVRVAGAEYSISGKIDRLDSFSAESGRYYRVLDYKQGGQEFQYAELFNGLKLQLPLYVTAALAADRAAKAAGLYYLPVKEPALPDGTPEEKLEAALLAEFRLSGLTLDRPEVVAATVGDPQAPSISTRSKKGLLSEGDMQAVLDFAVGKAQSSLEGIMQGRAEASPYYNGKTKYTPCAHCDYASACRFDLMLPGCAYRWLQLPDKEEFFELIGGQDEG